MLSGRATALLLALGIAGAAATVACTTEVDDHTTSDDEIQNRPIREANAVLESTFLLASGCSAAKVGPRHLLVAARCVVGHDEVKAGLTLQYEIAKGKTATQRKPRSKQDTLDAGAAEPENDSTDALDAGPAEDAAAAPVMAAAIIEKVEVNATYTTKCANDLCDFGSLGASEGKDVAVIVLTKELDKAIPTIPVDLDSVREGDTLVAVGGGCRTLDAPPRRERMTRTLAVPAKAATHAGSVYERAPALVSRLDKSYITTPGRGWRSGDPGICRTDIGAPLFRSGGTIAVAGITSNFTFEQASDPVPVTLQHTRVDTASEVGPWLETLGVETIHSCFGGGCVKTNVTADVPTPAQMNAARLAPDLDTSVDDEDAGLIAPDAGDAKAPWQSQEVGFGNEVQGGYSDSDPDYADAGRPKKTKIISACSSAPGPAGNGSPLAFAALGLALVSLARRRGASRRG